MRSTPNVLAALEIVKDNPSKSYDAMQLMHEYHEKYKPTERIDWHEFSNILDSAERHGFLDVADRGGWYDGMVGYEWNPAPVKRN